MLPRPTLEAFDAWLMARALRFEAVVVGGSALAECIALAPTSDELSEAHPWLSQRDTNPQWPGHVRATLEDLGTRLGHGL